MMLMIDNIAHKASSKSTNKKILLKRSQEKCSNNLGDNFNLWQFCWQRDKHWKSVEVNVLA